MADAPSAGPVFSAAALMNVGASLYRPHVGAVGDNAGLLGASMFEGASERSGRPGSEGGLADLLVDGERAAFANASCLQLAVHSTQIGIVRSKMTFGRAHRPRMAGSQT